MHQLFDGIDRVDALCVTSATQVHNLFSVAEKEGRAAALLEGLQRAVVAAVGPVAASALRDHGMHVDVEPEHPHMGTMMRDLARYVEARA
jgi:uroporphyrinogen-III synthase